jgi:tRNA pseudouridine55 synthase
MNINGVLNLYKRKGISSFKAVSEVKRVTGAAKAGHTGTLDPEAEGVLPVCLGKSTRIADYIQSKEKEYKVRLYLGIETDTCDLEGEIISEAPVFGIKEEDIRKTARSVEGDSLQMPPLYSAVKVKGRKLYEYARRGETVEIKPRPINIRRILVDAVKNTEYLGRELIDISLTVACSKGTYMRSLCRDIGLLLGTRGTMAGLVRTKSGKFDITGSHTIEEIGNAVENKTLEDLLINAEDILDLSKIELNEKQTEDYNQGRIVVMTGFANGEYLVKSSSGYTIGIGFINESGILRGRKRLI